MAHRDLADISNPTLMRSARGTYARSIRAQLQPLGFDDLPRNGAFVMAGVAVTGGPRAAVASDLGVTKQAMSQAIDVLVTRGYLNRSIDPDDRRRTSLAVTERGQQVLDAVVRGVEAVDAQLRERVSEEQVAAMRTALIALAEIKAESAATGAGVSRPVRQLPRFSPIFPVRELPAALAHYQALGFAVSPHEDGAEYGFADKDGLQLHLAAAQTHPRVRGGAAYLYVRDADALFEQWSRPGIGGQTSPVFRTEYRMREGSHTDPDGNLIRFGSPADE